MAIDNTQSNFRRGVMSLVILTLLKREDMYGYQLVQEISKFSSGRITTQEGSLYPVLYKLVDQGFISDRRVQVGKRMTRVYYHLEPAGKAHGEELVKEYTQVTQGVFQIIQRSEEGAQYSESALVSVGDLSGAAGQLEAEETNSFQNEVLHPELSF